MKDFYYPVPPEIHILDTEIELCVKKEKGYYLEMRIYPPAGGGCLNVEVGFPAKITSNRTSLILAFGELGGKLFDRIKLYEESE